MFGIRTTLRIGAIVFGVSSVLLLVAPGLFLELLRLDGGSAPLQWSMRMIGLTLIALSANMWFVARSTQESTVRAAGIVMAIVATLLGIVTLSIPAPLGWFAICYAGVGFLFGLNYAICLLRVARASRA